MKTRAQSLICLTAGCLGLSMGVFAADVVIHPGNGVETNIAPIASASAVRVNPGTSGGGIVHLNAQNAYTAPTTLGCGTLVADRMAASGTASSIGKSGLVSIGAGTFRYDGPDGGWTDRTFTNDTPVNTQAAIYDIRHDLTLASDLVQARGSFVKTGPGTLHLAGNLVDGRATESEVNKIKLLMKQLKLTTDDRPTTTAAHERELKENAPSAAIQLADGSIITAHSSTLLSASAALIINALKHLANIDHSLQLIPQQTIAPIQKTKVDMLHSKAPRLHSDEVLVTLSILSLSDPNCRKALDCLPQLEGCQVHATKMLSEVDRKIFKRLGIQFTTDPVKV